MQLSQSKSDAILVGDIQNNKVGIDRSNIDFITTLLSTNLYSKPIQSFLRETVANGWDSQVEAGTTDTPLLIRITTNKEGGVDIAVRDYGTGLSPERFDTIYRNIGSSTKRESNDYIGCMGIGRFSALACSDIVKIKSFYEGKCYSYLMYKDGRSICIDKTSELEGYYENGVEVCVSIPYSKDNEEYIQEGINALAYFEGVYVHDEVFGTEGTFNNRKIHDFKAFRTCNMFTNEYYGMSDVHVLMGNVLYPVDKSMVTPIFGNNPPAMALRCNIGDLEITPNRENLIYNGKTKDAINSKLKEALAECVELARQQVSQDWPTVNKWYEYMKNTDCIINVFDFGTDSKVYWKVTKMDLFREYKLHEGQTIRGKAIPKNFMEYVKRFKNMSIPERMVTYKFRNDQFQITHIGRQEIYNLENYIEDQSIYCLDAPLTPIAKKYFREVVRKDDNSWRAVLFLNLKDMRGVFINMMRSYILYVGANPNSKRVTPYSKEAVRLIWDDWKEQYFKIPSYNNSDVPQDFKDANKPAPKQRGAARKCVVYTLVEGETYNYTLGANNIKRDSNKYDSQKVGKFKGTVVYDEKGSDDLTDLYLLMKQCAPNAFNKHLFVEVAPSNIPVIQANKNCVSLAGFIYQNNRVLSKILTAYHIVNTMKVPDTRLLSYGSKVDKSPVNPMWEAIIKIREIHKTIRNFPSISHRPGIYALHLYEIYRDRGWLDYEMITDAERTIPYLLMDYKIQKLKENNTTVNEIFTALYLLQNGTCKGDVKTIQGLRNILTKLKLDESTKNSLKLGSDS